MKLSQGEFVALESIENVYSTTPLVAQLFVYGDSLQAYLLAVVVVDRLQLAPVLSDMKGVPVDPEDDVEFEKAVRDPKVNALYMKELNKRARSRNLNGYVPLDLFNRSFGRLMFLWIRRCSFEMIKRIHLTLEPFSVENECLTPTLKIKRLVIYCEYHCVVRR